MQIGTLCVGKTDRVKVHSRPACEPRDLSAFWNIDAEIPIPTPPSKGLRRAKVGDDPQRIHVSAATAGETHNVFARFQAKTRGAASISAVSGCFEQPAIARAIDHLHRIDELTAVHSDLDYLGPLGDIAVGKVRSARTTRERGLAGRRCVSRRVSVGRIGPSAQRDERQSDGVKILSGAPSESRCLRVRRDLDSEIAVSSASAECGRSPLVGLELDGSNVGSRPARNPNEIFVGIETENTQVAARAAMSGASNGAKPGGT